MSELSNLIDILKTNDSKLLTPLIQETIAKWDDPPKAIQVLQALDYAVHTAGAAPLIMFVLKTLYKETCKVENTTHELVVEQATWRNFEFRGHKER